MGDNSIRGGSLVHELWPPLRCSHGLHFSALLWMIDCAEVRSALLSDVSDVIPQRCMLPHSPLLFPRPGQCVKVCGVMKGGHFCSLLASSHLIKRAQEMSLLADWPCVVLRRPPSGTADMHAASPTGGGGDPPRSSSH